MQGDKIHKIVYICEYEYWDKETFSVWIHNRNRTTPVDQPVTVADSTTQDLCAETNIEVDLQRTEYTILLEQLQAFEGNQQARNVLRRLDDDETYKHFLKNIIVSY